MNGPDQTKFLRERKSEYYKEKTETSREKQRKINN